MKYELLPGKFVEVDPETIDNVVFKPEGPRDANNVLWVWNRLKKFDAPVMVNVGAHFGLYPLLAALNRNVTVWAYEPHFEAFRILDHNMRLNNIETFTCCNYALGSEVGQRVLKVPNKKIDWGLATIGKPMRFTDDYDSTVIEVMTIDNEHFAQLDVLTIDVEGYELFVLQGGEQTIKECKPRMLIEYDERNTGQCGYKPIAIKMLLDSWGATTKVNDKELMVWWP